MLTAMEQWDLHEFFELTKKLTDEQLVAHRKSLTDRSLPQRAGRAYVRLAMFTDRLEQERAAPKPPTKKRKRGAPYAVSVEGLVNPDLTPEMLAKIIVDAAWEAVRKENLEAQQKELKS